MICVYDIGNTNFDGNGDAVLDALSASIKMVAGGNYDITLVHPLDKGGKWQHLVPGAIVKAPVPVEVIENAYAGYDVDVYVTTTNAALRETAQEPQTISYPAWNINTDYAVGAKVSNGGKNWICTYYDETSKWSEIAPSAGCTWWSEIPKYIPGGTELVTLPAGTELYFVEDVDSTWYKMSTPYGITGYILKSAVEYEKHLTPEELQPRVIKEQLFRLREPAIDNDGQRITVTGMHVSYDLAGILIREVSLCQASPALAIGRLMDGLMMPYSGTIATNLTSDANGTYTGDIKGQNGIFALMDPDKGIVAGFDAKLSRDNWDLFLMARTNTDRGFRIRYGVNANGINWKKSSAGLVTRVVPVAKAEDGSDLYLPELWVDSPLISQYPVIIMERLSVKGQVGKEKETKDGSSWTLSELLDEMRDKAGERFSVDHADRVTEEVTVQFSELSRTAEYACLKGLESVLLYDSVTAVDERIGLNVSMYVTEIEYDAVKEKITGIKLSNVINKVKRSVTGFNVNNNSISSEKLMDGVLDEVVQKAIDAMPEYADPEAERPAVHTMNSKTEDGYVLKGNGQAGKVWKTDSEGNPAWRSESTVEVVDNLNSTSSTKALSAGQGKVLNDNKVDKGADHGGTLHYPVLTGVKLRNGADGSNTLVSLDPTTDGSIGGILHSQSDRHFTFREKTAGTNYTEDYFLPVPTTTTEDKNYYIWTTKTLNTGYTTSGKNYAVQTDSDGKMYVNVPWSDTQYTLPLAANGTRGGVQIGYSESGKKYAVKLSNEKMYVEVPWTADGGAASTATQFAANQTVELTGDTTGSASSKAGWTIDTSTKKVSYGSALTSSALLDAFLSENKFQTAIWSYNDDSTASWPGINNGIILSGGWQSNSYGFQLAIDDDPTWFIKLRQLGNGTWSAWKRIPMGDGTGASGTWGISITGDAATVNGKTVEKNVPSNAVFTDTTYSAGNGIAFNGTVISQAIIPGANVGTFGPTANVDGTDGTTIAVPYLTVDSYGRVTAAGSKVYTSRNTWRGIQNNLTSTSTTDSLSAAQGKALNDAKVDRAGDTMTGMLSMKTTNNVAFDFRPDHSGYTTTFSYQTSGNEALVIATKNDVTSFIFINGEDSVATHASNRWQSLTAPGMQIKNNCVNIGGLWANGVTPTCLLKVGQNSSSSAQFESVVFCNGGLFYNNTDMGSAITGITQSGMTYTATRANGNTFTFSQVEDSNKVDKGGDYGGTIHYPVLTGVKLRNAGDGSNAIVSLDPTSGNSIGGILHDQSDRHFTFREYTAGKSYYENYFLPVPTVTSSNSNYYILTTKTYYTTRADTTKASVLTQSTIKVVRFSEHILLLSGLFNVQSTADIADNTTVLTTPSGYRPAYQITIAAFTLNNATNNPVILLWDTDGTIKTYNSGTNRKLKAAEWYWLNAVGIG